jgi:hypothetical protein
LYGKIFHFWANDYAQAAGLLAQEKRLHAHFLVQPVWR